MKDLHTIPDENLEARITAWVLGEASPFEAAEIEVLCSADPELQFFLNRTRTMHSLLLETPTSDSDHFWKLSPPKREKLDPIIGPNNPSRAHKNSSRPRAAYRTMFGIAAVLAVTLFIKQFFFSPSKDLPLTMASASSELNSEMPATGRTNIDTHNDLLADGKVGDKLRTSAPAIDALVLSDQLALNGILLEEKASLESNRLLKLGQGTGGASSAKSLQTAPKHDIMRKDPAPEKRELLSSHATVAKFIGIKEHRCMGRTSLCPDRCGDSGKLATFEIIEYLDYQKPGEYGDPKQTTFHVLIRDNQGSAKIPDEILSIIDSLKPDTKVKLSWRHDYVTKDQASFPERPITKIEAEQ